jgi:hypothetical protein
MKRWNQWTRKHEGGWVEQRHRFLKKFAERIPEAAGQKVPAVAGVTVPETRVTVSNRGEK